MTQLIERTFQVSDFILSGMKDKGDYRLVENIAIATLGHPLMSGRFLVSSNGYVIHAERTTLDNTVPDCAVRVENGYANFSGAGMTSYVNWRETLLPERDENGDYPAPWRVFDRPVRVQYADKIADLNKTTMRGITGKGIPAFVALLRVETGGDYPKAYFDGLVHLKTLGYMLAGLPDDTTTYLTGINPLWLYNFIERGRDTYIPALKLWGKLAQPTNGASMGRAGFIPIVCDELTVTSARRFAMFMPYAGSV